MPTVYTFKAKFAQPVHVIFHCEYCDHSFTRTGQITTDELKTEKWVTARGEEAQAELRTRGEGALEKARAFLDQSIANGAFTKRFLGEGSSIHFDDGKTCPECGYAQRIAPPKRNLKLTIARFGCGGILLFFFAMALIPLLQGTATDLAYVFLIGAPLLIAVLIASTLVNPNRAFMKKHGLKKQDLPQPRKPEIDYGQIHSV